MEELFRGKEYNWADPRNTLECIDNNEDKYRIGEFPISCKV